MPIAETGAESAEPLVVTAPVAVAFRLVPSMPTGPLRSVNAPAPA
jgi:hypothetical protein